MSNPAFFVDGITEQRAIQKICPGVKINTTQCNGKSVTIPTIAKRLSSLIKLLNNRHYPIIIIIDREDRKESSEEIKNLLENELLEINIGVPFFVGVCDRMIENWMLADVQNLQKYSSKTVIPPSNYDSLHGKSTIKKIIPSYHETTDGVKILSSCCSRKLYRNSPSFKLFAETIKGQIECHWLENAIVEMEATYKEDAV